MNKFKGILSECIELRNLAAKARGYPVYGSHTGAGKHVNLDIDNPPTDYGENKPGWTIRVADSVADGYGEFIIDVTYLGAEIATNNPRLNASEKARALQLISQIMPQARVANFKGDK